MLSLIVTHTVSPMKNTRYLSFTFAVFAVAFALLTVPARAGFHDNRETAIAESGKAQSVPGAEKFTIEMPTDKAFSAVVTALQKADYEIADANKDGGLISTAIVVTGGWRQTGTRAVLTIIRDSDSTSIVKVVVTEQKRYKALQTEPWGEPKANAEKTTALATALRTALGVK